MATWGTLFSAGVTLLGVASAAHAMLNKRDPRAGAGWVAMCLFLPLIGSAAYWIFGVNRIRTRGRKLSQRWPTAVRGATGSLEVRSGQDPSLPEVARLGEKLTGRPLLGGNRVRPLFNGEEAYPAMLEAIASAQHWVHLSTYIFDSDEVGRRFVDELAEARHRGAEVRVLVDGVGELYSWPRISRLLRKRNVNVQRFLPPGFKPPALSINLRNHRKLLIVDGRLAFTGGMNIGTRHMLSAPGKRGLAADMHFQIEGPVIEQLESGFREDWAFVCTETVTCPFPAMEPMGTAFCRGIVDGPNEDVNRLKWILLGAISAASRRVRIMTPYFIPDREMIATLIATALRGIDVKIILPERSNLPYVDWASRAMHWELLKHDVRIFFQPAPFAHTKLLVVDDGYSQIGSANLDPRSMRLNFELNLEVLDRGFAEVLIGHFEAVLAACRETDLTEVDARPLPVKLRDGAAKLAAPYL
jgi:cardiolipin synthase